MNICVIEARKSRTSELLKLQAEEMNLQFKRTTYTDFFYSTNETGFKVQHRKLDLHDYDVFLFRNVETYSREVSRIAKYLTQIGKRVIDSVSSKCDKCGIHNKLADLGIAMPERYFTQSLKAARDILIEVDHPLVIYSDNNGSSKLLVSEDWTDSYDFVKTAKSRNFIFQKVYNANYFLRVYVIGKVICIIKKTPSNHVEALNFDTRFKNELIQNPDIAEFANDLCRQLEYEYCYIDILETDQAPIVLDIKRAPQIAKVSRFCKINFSHKILEMMEGKV